MLHKSVVFFTKILLSGRCDNNPPADNAFIVPEWLIPGDVEVFQIQIRDSNGILAPVVTKGFKVTVVVVLTVYLEVNDHPFLLSVYFRHSSAIM